MGFFDLRFLPHRPVGFCFFEGSPFSDGVGPSTARMPIPLLTTPGLEWSGRNQVGVPVAGVGVGSGVGTSAGVSCSS